MKKTSFRIFPLFMIYKQGFCEDYDFTPYIALLKKYIYQENEKHHLYTSTYIYNSLSASTFLFIVLQLIFFLTMMSLLRMFLCPSIYRSFITTILAWRYNWKIKIEPKLYFFFLFEFCFFSYINVYLAIFSVHVSNKQTKNGC